MPSFIVHGLIPPLILLAFRLAPPRAVLWMLPFTWLPDLDYVVGIHRATTSNLLFLLPFVVAWLGWRKTRPTWSPYAGVAAFYVASHLAMDLFAGGIVPFWPFWDRTFFLHFEVIVDTSTNQPVPISDVGTQQGAPEVARYFQWISPIETAMLALTAAVGLGFLVYRWRTGRWPTLASDEASTPAGSDEQAAGSDQATSSGDDPSPSSKTS